MGVREAAAPAPADAVPRAVLTGFIDRIGLRELRRDDRARYTGTRGLRFRIFPGSSVKSTPRWIVAASLIETSTPFAMTVAAVRRAWLEEAGAALLKRSYRDPHWRIESGRVEAFEQSTLYGLQVYAKRRVDYGVVDRERRTCVFLGEALVAGRLGVRPQFLAHNMALERELLGLEAKLRRRDLLATPRQRVAFYAARVPVTISDRREFERWRYEAERHEPRLLYMTRDDVLATDAPAVEPGDYPDDIELAGQPTRAALSLRAGRSARRSHADGAGGAAWRAATIDARSARTGLARRADRSLALGTAQVLRRLLPTFQPLARELSEALRGEGSALAEAVSRLLRARTGVTLRADAIRTEALADPSASAAATARRRRSHARRGSRSRERSRHALPRAVTRRVREPTWEREGLTSFDLDEIPAEVLVREGGVQLRVHPALEDHGASVTLRLMRSPQAAERATRGGLARLFMLAQPQQAIWIRDRIGRERNIVLLAQGLRHTGAARRSARAQRVRGGLSRGREALVRTRRTSRHACSVGAPRSSTEPKPRRRPLRRTLKCVATCWRVSRRRRPPGLRRRRICALSSRRSSAWISFVPRRWRSCSSCHATSRRSRCGSTSCATGRGATPGSPHRCGRTGERYCALPSDSAQRGRGRLRARSFSLDDRGAARVVVRAVAAERASGSRRNAWRNSGNRCAWSCAGGREAAHACGSASDLRASSCGAELLDQPAHEVERHREHDRSSSSRPRSPSASAGSAAAWPAAGPRARPPLPIASATPATRLRRGSSSRAARARPRPARRSRGSCSRRGRRA